MSLTSDLKRYLLQEKATLSHVPVELHFAQKKEINAPLLEISPNPLKGDLSPPPLLKKPLSTPEKVKETPPEKEVSAQKALAEKQISDFFSLMRSIAPHLKLHPSPPKDQMAKEKKEAWKWFLELPEIALIFPNSGGEGDLFLSQVAKALTTRFGLSRVIDLIKMQNSNRSEMIFQTQKIQCIITSRAVIQSSPFLLKHLKESSQKNQVFLGTIPTLIIENPPYYLKQAEKKKGLWEMLSSHFDKKS